jgi:hypothetical protein
LHDHPHKDGKFPVETVIAGSAAGYAMALLTTAALTFLVVTAGEHGFARRWLETETPGSFSAVPISIAMFVLWPIIGLVVAGVFELGNFSQGTGFAGAPNIGFAVGIGALGWLPVPFLSLFWGRHWWLWCVLAASFTLLFGWMVPLLAGR